MIIGIDPGITKSGVAIVEKEKLLQVMYLHLWELFKFLEQKKENALIVFENSNLIKGNWHNASARGNVGKNKAVSQIIQDFLEKNKFNYIAIKPSGFSVMANHDKLFKSISKFQGKTNEHERSAYFIARAGYLSKTSKINHLL
jgi:hypothetical protein